MALANKTLYVYDKTTGRIKYTIDNPTSKQIQHIELQGGGCHVDLRGKALQGSYVVKNPDTGISIGIESLKTINFNISQSSIVANGTDVAVLSDLHPGATVTGLNDDAFTFVATEEDNDIEFTANGLSTNSTENQISLYFF